MHLTGGKITANHILSGGLGNPGFVAEIHGNFGASATIRALSFKKGMMNPEASREGLKRKARSQQKWRGLEVKSPTRSEGAGHAH